MAYMNENSKYGEAIEMKEKGYTSLKKTAGEDGYYSTIDNSDYTTVTDKTPSVQPATTNQQIENVISDSQLKISLTDMKDDIDLLKKKNNMLKIGLIISLFVSIVALAASSSATAIIFKQNLENSLKRKTEAQVSEGILFPWSNWGKCSVTCNVGVRSRNRTCNGTGPDGTPGVCFGNDVDISTCNNKDCTQGQPVEPGPSDVSFNARLKNNLTNVRLGTTVVFGGVIKNVGNAYNTSTSIFTCPTAGTYLFSLTVQGMNNKTTGLQVTIDGTPKVFAISEPAFENHDSTGTCVLVYQLKVDQRVWVETYKIDNTDIFKNFTRFVGVLIHR